MIEQTRFEDGKYVVVQDEGRTHVLRHGEPWRDETGDKFINAMVDEVKALRTRLDEIAEIALTTSVAASPNAAQAFKTRVLLLARGEGR